MPSRVAIVLFSLAIVVTSSGQQSPTYPPIVTPFPDKEPTSDTRLPNGKRQIDEILKSEREKSIDDVKQLIEQAQALQKDLEAKESQQVLSLGDLHRTEEIEKLAKRIRSRIRRN